MAEPNRKSSALVPAVFLPSDFEYGAVPSTEGSAGQSSVAPETPSLGPLTAFRGTFTGPGFNSIFRPDLGTTTKLAKPVQSDNLLELNLTHHTLSFSRPLGSVPNRGEFQHDIFLNGVTYLLTVTDVTRPEDPIGIHFEPGLWMCVPPTTDPAEEQTLVRMASIPHGTTICAQGTSRTFSGPPSIPPVSMTPDIGRFDSQTASNSGTARIPQDLTRFIKDGSITQDILDDPNTILRDAIAHQNITSTTSIGVSDNPSSPLFGGGTVNMAFLLGNSARTAPNAQTTEMSSFFWIETVKHVINVPAWSPGQPPLTIPAETPGAPATMFSVHPPAAVTRPRTLTVTSTQIQFSQRVVLNFLGILWPHISVATLVPAFPVEVPASAWPSS